MPMYLLVSHMGSVMASSKSYKWQGQTSVFLLLVACRSAEPALFWGKQLQAV